MDVLDHSSLVTRGITHNKSFHVGSRTEKIDTRKLSFWSGVGTEITLSSKGSWGSRCKHVPVIYCGPRSVQDAESRNVCTGHKHQHGISRHDKEAEKSIDSALAGHPEFPRKTSIYRSHGFAEAWRHAYNDAKFVNERAKNDMILLSRGITKLNIRARQDVAIIGVEFLKLDARAREDTVKIDDTVKKKASRLQRLAEILKEKAHTKLKKVADKHWSAGALEADLRRADFFARRRAMEDAYMAITLTKSIHDIMVGTVYHFPKNDGTTSQNSMMGQMMLEENGKTVDVRAGEVSADRITAIQEAYMSMASALSEADGIDYTDPDELELLVATLIDLDAMDGKSSVSLLAECSSSPDVSTRQALANTLGAASSMWTLGNAGMGALQRLAEDSNPAVAKAASKAIDELKRQWEIEEADNWLFKIDLKPTDSDGLETLDSDSNSDDQEDEP